MHDADQMSVSDFEDEELQQLMRQRTDDGLSMGEYTPSETVVKTASSLAKTPHTPKSHTRVYYWLF